MDIIEQLKRIADALESHNTLNREIFEHNKQVRAEDIAALNADYELAHKSGTTNHQPLPSSYPLETVIRDLRMRGGMYHE